MRSLERATTRTLTSTFDLDDLDDGDSAGGTAPAVDWLCVTSHIEPTAAACCTFTAHFSTLALSVWTSYQTRSHSIFKFAQEVGD